MPSRSLFSGLWIVNYQQAILFLKKQHIYPFYSLLLGFSYLLKLSELFPTCVWILAHQFARMKNKKTFSYNHSDQKTKGIGSPLDRKCPLAPLSGQGSGLLTRLRSRSCWLSVGSGVALPIKFCLSGVPLLTPPPPPPCLQVAAPAVGRTWWARAPAARPWTRSSTSTASSAWPAAPSCAASPSSPWRRRPTASRATSWVADPPPAFAFFLLFTWPGLFLTFLSKFSKLKWTKWFFELKSSEIEDTSLL